MQQLYSPIKSNIWRNFLLEGMMVHPSVMTGGHP
jgi:hypothetical protein